LWLHDCVSTLVFASVFLAVALHPLLSVRSALFLSGFAPVGYAVVIFATMGNFFAGYVMLLSGVAALAGCLLYDPHLRNSAA
jgi:hypothetical protein